MGVLFRSGRTGGDGEQRDIEFDLVKKIVANARLKEFLSSLVGSVPGLGRTRIRHCLCPYRLRAVPSH